MFNVCPGCGEYTDEKDVAEAGGKAICPDCGFAIEYQSLPLFVVTGASGSGKTTAALKLQSLTQDFVVLDQDVLWIEAFNEPANDYRTFRNTWLRMVKNIHQGGKSVVLFGTAIPEQYEKCVERRYLNCIHYLALVCQPEELKQRLKERPQWRKSGSEENLDRMVDFNNWLTEKAETTEPPMAVLDTTRANIQDTVKSIMDWLQRHNPER